MIRQRIESIDEAIEAIQAARLDWCVTNSIYSELGIVLMRLAKTRDKARRAIESQPKLSATRTEPPHAD